MNFTKRTSGRNASGGCRLMTAAAVCVLIQASRATAASAPDDLTVREEKGVYTVMARFTVDQPPSVALTVLTDYEHIPRFMPEVRTSIVRERAAGWAVVEQEAVSHIMLFSRRVHLVLEIEEQGEALTFSDRCGQSFAQYEGAWRLSARDGHTMIIYELTADPLFGVPAFMLKRLLERDSGEMIERLQREIKARAGDAPDRRDPK
jgi:carbon monoxide dehydrogenase subunit G